MTGFFISMLQTSIPMQYKEDLEILAIKKA